MSNSDEELTREAKRAFDESVDRLDAATLSRLNQGRHAALAELEQPATRAWLRWAPATGLAAVLMLMFSLQGPDVAEVMQAPVSDLDILLGEDSIEMIEDIEFYSWLDSEDFEGDGDVG